MRFLPVQFQQAVLVRSQENSPNLNIVTDRRKGTHHTWHPVTDDKLYFISFILQIIYFISCALHSWHKSKPRIIPITDFISSFLLRSSGIHPTSLCYARWPFYRQLFLGTTSLTVRSTSTSGNFYQVRYSLKIACFILPLNDENSDESQNYFADNLLVSELSESPPQFANFDTMGMRY
jgi:hypothetical protein